MKVRSSWLLSAGLGSALALVLGCSSSPPSEGLWSCFDTGSGVACVQRSALSTSATDVNGDGVPDHFVCSDDDNDGHDHGRDQDQAGHAVSGNDSDHDGIDDALDCDQRDACESLTDEANHERREATEVEAEGGHSGGDDGGEHS